VPLDIRHPRSPPLAVIDRVLNHTATVLADDDADILGSDFDQTLDPEEQHRLVGHRDQMLCGAER
jgi:hypothetical protein